MRAIIACLRAIIPKYFNTTSSISLQVDTTFIRDYVPAAAGVMTQIVNRFVNTDSFAFHIFTAFDV